MNVIHGLMHRRIVAALKPVALGVIALGLTGASVVGCGDASLLVPPGISSSRLTVDTTWYFWNWVNNASPVDSFQNGQCALGSDYKSDSGWDEDWAGGPWTRNTVLYLPVDARYMFDDPNVGPAKGCLAKMWQPHFQQLDAMGNPTGQEFWLNHLQHPDGAGNGWLVLGHDYNAGTAIGLIGGGPLPDNCNEGYPTFSTGDHGCMVTPDTGAPPCKFLPQDFMASSQCLLENGNAAYPNPLCPINGNQPTPNPGVLCPGPGDYCGSDGVKGGDDKTLYHCPGKGQAPTSSQNCASGCSTMPANAPDQCAGQTCGAADVVEGVDVSEYQKAVDWNAVAHTGRAFAIARIGDGTYLDATFDANWPAIKAAGLIRGAYQYFRAQDDPAALASIVIGKVGKLGSGDLPVTLDFDPDSGGGLPPATVASKIATWVSLVQAGTGKTPMIYTGYFSWKNSVASAAFSADPLWLASYGSCPITPAGWTGWKLWQYSSSGMVAGINVLVDLDQFNGTVSDLQAIANGIGVAPPPMNYVCPGVGDYCGTDGLVGADPNSLFHCATKGQAPASQIACVHGCQLNPPGTPDVCGNAPQALVRCPGGGDFCGSDGVAGGDANALYHCAVAGQSPVSSTPCANGCSINPPGTPDTCQTVLAITCPGGGDYCGGDGVAGGDSMTLYHCAGAGVVPTTAKVCTNGCQVNGANVPDVCKGMQLAVSCPGTGAFCGNDGVNGGDANTLYQCPGANQAPSSSTACANGCHVNPPGTPDACVANGLQCPGAGAYCGNDGVNGGNANTLYQCPGANQAPSSSAACINGCHINPPGTPDVCVVNGLQCPGAGAYCGNDGVNGGNANTLYQCPGANQAPSSSTACINGCHINPPGTPDVCAANGLRCPAGGAFCGNDGVSGGDASTLYQCPGAGQAPSSSTFCANGCKTNPAGVPDVCK